MEVLERWFGADEGWERVATREQRRRDVQWAVVAFVIATLGVELIRAAGGMEEEERLGLGWQYAAVVSGSLLVAFRRVAPVLVMLLAAAHFVVAGQLMPMTMASLPMQLLAFFLFFSGIAWARDRRAVTYATLAVLVVMALWLAWWFALGSGLDNLREQLDGVTPSGGPLGPVTALLLYLVLNNLLYFGFAIGLGLVAWRGALERSRADDLLVTTQTQALRLRNQAVVDERLRIARELHDVVAHHVSVMGVQATAARRVLARDPVAAGTALGAIEQSSRDAVGQMRDLLGTLRSEDPDEGDLASGEQAGTGHRAPEHRAPQPTLAALPELMRQASTPTCEVELDLVESTPGAAGRVPPPVQLSAYRVVQEALANVRRHSTARHARVTVRVDEPDDEIEIEVVDDGHPRWGTSGTGLGQRGMRERAQHLGGGVEAGPRAGMAGYRVRAWFPLEGRARVATATEDASLGA